MSSSAEVTSSPLTHAFYARDVLEVARELIGATLLVNGVGGIIVETEAYRQDDPASHSYAGVTRRTGPMFGPPGCAYVYRSYGIHWCLNIVCGAAPGGAVLIRALEPSAGLEAMAQRRGQSDPRHLCSGPGKLGQALKITHGMSGMALDAPPFAVLAASRPYDLLVGPRIGIAKAVDLPWRFGAAGSRFLSRPFPKAVARA
jgi:DNA-3-methyladenine glycosylase